MDNANKLKVMVAGIGGASLGTEILKCLMLAGRYEVFGCDISPTAYGLYEPGFKYTFVADREDYIASVIESCNQVGAQWIVPGGEQPMILLGAADEQLTRSGIKLLANNPQIIQTFADKSKTFKRLSELGLKVPYTAEVNSIDDFNSVSMPCIVKPATGSGGSAMVFFATAAEEAMSYAGYIRNSGSIPLLQEYIPHYEGEFTVGVLSLPGGEVLGSIALQRVLDNKLSVLSRDRGGIISSGYSQGFIGDFPEIRKYAEQIALAVGSEGAFNIQGRVRDGEFIPFEINPRLSASTYLRAMAGMNEVDMLLQHLALDNPVQAEALREGWYLRSFTENFIAPEELRK